MPHTLAIGAAARLLGLSRSRVQQLTDAGVLSAERTAGGHRRYDESVLRREWAVYRGHRPPADHDAAARAIFDRDFVLEGASEDDVWRELTAEIVGTTGPIPAESRRLLAYAVTEMVNNAIDHSRGTRVRVVAAESGGVISIRIQDDGVGAFAKLATLYEDGTPEDAILDITKGRRTTAPEAHAGEGIFFTSKAMDVFELAANGLRVVFDNTIGDIAYGESAEPGTTVALRLDLATARTLRGVFDRFSDQENGFYRSVPRIELVRTEGEFVSRSEAKRVAAGLEKFRRVELDFTGVEMIGQGFADQLLRVWASENPRVDLVAVGANRGVQLMIDHVTRGR